MSVVDGDTLMITILKSGKKIEARVDNYTKHERTTLEVFPHEYKKIESGFKALELKEYSMGNGGQGLNPEDNHVIGYLSITASGREQIGYIVPKSETSEALKPELR